MKKILISMFLLAGLAAATPAMAQRGNRVEPTEHNNNRRGDHDGDGRHYKKGKGHGHHKAGVHDNRYGDKHRKGVHGKKHGQCRKAGPVQGPRRSGRG